MTRRARGFTLVELMVVVTIIGVIASIAIVSLRRSRSTGDADQWANTLRNLAQQARRRAIATNSTYMLDVRQNSARWCQVDDSSCSAPTTSCPNSTAGRENGGIMYAPADAVTDSYAAKADVTAPGAAYGAPAHSSFTTTTVLPIYFGANGTVDTNDCNVNATGQVMAGVTVYVRASNAVSGTSTSEKQKRRRVVFYGISGRPRIIDNW